MRITVFEQVPWKASLRLYHPEAVMLEFRTQSSSLLILQSILNYRRPSDKINSVTRAWNSITVTIFPLHHSIYLFLFIGLILFFLSSFFLLYLFTVTFLVLQLLFYCLTVSFFSFLPSCFSRLFRFSCTLLFLTFHSLTYFILNILSLYFYFSFLISLPFFFCSPSRHVPFVFSNLMSYLSFSVISFRVIAMSSSFTSASTQVHYSILHASGFRLKWFYTLWISATVNLTLSKQGKRIMGVEV